jgi:tetratricopeptide (TPR) repeat protein
LCFSSIILSKTWGEPSDLFIKFAGDEPHSVRAKLNYAAYLEAQNLPEFAMPVIEEAMVLRPDMLSITLAKMRLACESNLDIEINEHIEKIRNAHFFETGVILQLEELITIHPESCPILSENPNLLEEILDLVPTMRGAGFRPNVMARLYYLKSNYYVNNRKFEEAMDALDIAIEFTPTVDFYLRKAVLLTSAGLYRQAVESIQNASEADKERSYLMPSRIKEIENVSMLLGEQSKSY